MRRCTKLEGVNPMYGCGVGGVRSARNVRYIFSDISNDTSPPKRVKTLTDEPKPHVLSAQ